MTVGAALSGLLPPPPPLADAPELANPATAVAIASAPTSTPDLSVCPTPRGGVVLEARPQTVEEGTERLLRFFNQGGTTRDLNASLRLRWRQVGDPASPSADLLGGGQGAVIVAYRAPGDLGVLHVFACLDGRYRLIHSVNADGEEPPQVAFVGDMNAPPPAELVISRRVCLSADDCELETQILAWDGARLANLLDAPLRSLELPQARDVDEDRVLELVVNLTSRGSSQTGPLRTGVHIYDWDGLSYTLSILQLDPPRFRIQVVHEGDKAFSRQDYAAAAEAYRLALDDEGLRAWYNDETDTLLSYALYRLILASSLSSDGRLSEALTRLNTQFPLAPDADPASLPPFVLMAYRWSDSFARSGDLHVACIDTLLIVEEQPDILRLLNRYGSRSPSYAALDLCPF